MELAGKYCGMSPGLSNEFGFYEVESIKATERTGQTRKHHRTDDPTDERITKEAPTVADS
jgi:hypothetical protein